MVVFKIESPVTFEIFGISAFIDDLVSSLHNGCPLRFSVIRIPRIPYPFYLSEGKKFPF